MMVRLRTSSRLKRDDKAGKGGSIDHSMVAIIQALVQHVVPRPLTRTLDPLLPRAANFEETMRQNG